MSMQSNLRNRLLNEESLIFFLSFIILFNLGFHILVYFPLHQSQDMQNYLAMAQLDFDQSPIRRYRIIIPLVAYLINTLFGWCFNLFHPWSFEGDFSLCFSFLLINTAIMSFAMVIIYKLCKSFQIGFWVCLLAVVAVISSRWSAEISGLPLVDSLYVLCLVFTIYGLKTKQYNYLIAAIFIGPWAKEAFIFMVPVILLYAKTERLKMIMYLILAGIFVFGFRFLFDHYYGHEFINSFNEEVDTFSSIRLSINRLFSFHGLYDLFSIIGFWIFLPLVVYLKFRNIFSAIYKENSKLFSAYLVMVLFQALLSSDISRMFFLSIPVIAVWIAISLKVLKNQWNVLMD